MSKINLARFKPLMYKGEPQGERYLVDEDGEVYGIKSGKMIAVGSSRVTIFVNGGYTTIMKKTVVKNTFGSPEEVEKPPRITAVGLAAIQNSFITRPLAVSQMAIC